MGSDDPFDSLDSGCLGSADDSVRPDSESSPKFRIATPWFVLFRERAGVISERELWVCWLYGGGVWMHTGDTLGELFWSVFLYWKDDRFLVG